MSVKDKSGQTVLHYAARTLHDEAENIALLSQLVDLSLKESKSALSQMDNHGQTMLHVAAFHNRYSVIRFLATSVASISGSIWKRSKRETVDGLSISTWINNIDKKGRTPLHLAALQNSFQSVKLLLKARSDVNHQGSGSIWTPLKCAAQRGHAGIVKVLLDAGAKQTPVSLSDSGDYNEVDACIESGHMELARVMLAMQHDHIELESKVSRLQKRMEKLSSLNVSSNGRGGCEMCIVS
eukprot:CAMPEP_0167766652 /NCGR_PEP_ID=MMETSP0110_2-20121227/15489_1 /TAXON_ID=629695 /ORGANISM="Gymnochlora sp., Strain CCMP2014" /LENGTH=238 /DNA_ID=CAMNT_0007654755 /DNA_START=572 /DNA_END=1288 /DNA_ORIENTATION=-